MMKHGTVQIRHSTSETVLSDIDDCSPQAKSLAFVYCNSKCQSQWKLFSRVIDRFHYLKCAGLPFYPSCLSNIVKIDNDNFYSAISFLLVKASDCPNCTVNHASFHTNVVFQHHFSTEQLIYVANNLCVVCTSQEIPARLVNYQQTYHSCQLASHQLTRYVRWIVEFVWWTNLLKCRKDLSELCTENLHIIGLFSIAAKKAGLAQYSRNNNETRPRILSNVSESIRNP